MSRERDGKVLIKAHRELLHYFVISLLCSIVLFVAMYGFYSPKL